MTIKDITKLLETWKGEDKEDRAYLLITADDKGNQGVTALNGTGGALLTALASSAATNDYLKFIMEKSLGLAEIMEKTKKLFNDQNLSHEKRSGRI